MRERDQNELINLVDQLRGDGWMVVLKAMPEGTPFIIQGSHSEYDAPHPDIKLGAGCWCCEVFDMRDRSRNSEAALDVDPAGAVQRVIDLIASRKRRQ
jgi:hypothetical protein